MAQPIVILFAMPGCSACEEFWPRFEALAKPYYDHRGLPIQIYNPNQARALAQRHGIKYTPTMITQDAAGNIRRFEGAVSNNEILEALNGALR